MKLVQQLIVYIVLVFMIFVSQCFCRHTRKSPSKPAPVYLTEDQYGNLKSERLELNVTNTPENVFMLQIWTRQSNLTRKDNGTDHIFSTPGNAHEYWLPTLDLETGENGIFVSLWTKDGLCGTRPVLIVQNDNEILLAKSKTRTDDVDKKWLKECSRHSCVIELQWDSNCASTLDGTSGDNLVKSSPSVLKNMHHIVNTVFHPLDFGENLFNDDDIERDNGRSLSHHLQPEDWAKRFLNWISPQGIFKVGQKRKPDTEKNKYNIGGNLTFTCYLKGEVNSIIQWRQAFDKDTLMISPSTNITKFYMTLDAFDNNTKLECGRPALNQDNTPTHIQVMENKSTVRENLPVIRYNDAKKIDYNCTKEKPYNTRSEPTLRTYVALIKENTVNIIPDLHNITKSDSGSTIACFYYKVLKLDNLVIRYVENKTKLIYEEAVEQVITATGVHTATTAQPKSQNGNTSNLYYYIGGAAVVIIIILVIVLLTIKKCCYKSRKLTPEMKTSSIMNSKQVLYAELELYALPNGTIMPVLQQSPYGQIVHPKELLYANLNVPSPPQGAGRVHQEETPYAQIDPVTLPAQVDQQNGNTQIQVEGTPNTQVVKDVPKF